MKRIITIISAATAVLAFYNEAKRAGLIEPLNVKPFSIPVLTKREQCDDDEDDKKT